MFNFTNSQMKISNSGLEKIITNEIDEIPIKIIKTFEFQPALQRMSTIAQVEDLTKLYIKGSPETISLISKKSTIPDNFDYLNEKYSKVNFLN